MPHGVEPKPSFIEQLFSGGRRKRREDEAADHALDEALTRLSQALNDNSAASERVRRRQSSGSLKLVSLPEPAFEGAE